MTEFKVYRGQRGPQGTIVTVDSVPLDPRSDVREFHAEGYEWGYEGAGPRQLAFALMVDAFGEKVAFTRYRDFLRDVIAEIKDDGWTMTADDMAAGGGGEGGSDDGIVYVDMDLDTLMKKVRGEI